MHRKQRSSEIQSGDNDLLVALGREHPGALERCFLLRRVKHHEARDGGARNGVGAMGRAIECNAAGRRAAPSSMLRPQMRHMGRLIP